MSAGFTYLVSRAPVLRPFAGNPDAMLAHLGRASGGEERLIRAAMTLLHPLDRPGGAKSLTFELREVSGLDYQHAQALLEAIALEAGHPDLVR